MLLVKENRTLESQGVMQVARATIKTSPKIFNFFEKQTYSNVPRTICRELVANGWDSHQMAGKGDVPVELWLPTIFDPTFRVRDEGLGMSHEFMMNEFMIYADGSTKDQSNLAIGGFGIGSKSPFAKVDQYSLVSRFNGVESAYSIFKAEDGIPSIGLLGQRETTEPNGVEVSFPVGPEDFETFEEAALEALRYFEPLPIIKNLSDGNELAPPPYVAKGKTWGMREKAGPMNIIMGGVLYPVNASNLTYKFPSESAARKLLEYGLDLRVPIGTCSIALSREALAYDDATIEAIRTVSEEVISEVAARFATMFDKYGSAWEAAEALYNEVGEVAHGARARFLEEHAMWRGQPLLKVVDFGKPVTHRPQTGDAYPVYGYDVWHVGGRQSRRKRRGGYKDIGSAKFETPDNKFGGFTPGALAYVVIDDLPQKPSSKTTRKLKEFAEEHGEAMIVLRPHDWRGEDAPTVEQMVDAVGNPPADKLVLTSELPEPIMERGYTKNAARPRIRMFTYDGSYQRHNWDQPERRIDPKREGVREIPYAEQPDSGIMVVVENLRPPAELAKKVDTGLIRWTELRFVGVGDAKKLKKGNWVDWTVEFENRKQARLAAYPELAQRLAVSHLGCFTSVYAFFRRNGQVDFSSKKPLGRIFNLYKTYVEPLDEEQRKLAQFVEAKLPARLKPEELYQTFRDKQPKAWRLLQLLNGTLDEADLRLFQENL